MNTKSSKIVLPKKKRRYPKKNLKMLDNFSPLVDNQKKCQKKLLESKPHNRDENKIPDFPFLTRRGVTKKKCQKKLLESKPHNRDENKIPDFPFLTRRGVTKKKCQKKLLESKPHNRDENKI